MITTMLSASLDGFIAGPDDGPGKPLGVGGERLSPTRAAAAGPLPGAPLFVMTHHVPDSVPHGDPPYTFVTEGIESAVQQARRRRGRQRRRLDGREARTAGDPRRTARRLTIALVPVALGRGVRLLDELAPGGVQLEIVRVLDAPGVTHLSYRVVK